MSSMKGIPGRGSGRVRHEALKRVTERGVGKFKGAWEVRKMTGFESARVKLSKFFGGTRFAKFKEQRKELLINDILKSYEEGYKADPKGVSLDQHQGEMRELEAMLSESNSIEALAGKVRELEADEVETALKSAIKEQGSEKEVKFAEPIAESEDLEFLQMQEDSDELLNMLDKLALEKKVVLLMQKQIELNNYMEDLRNEIGEDALELFGKDGTVVRLEAEIAELNAGIEELEGRVGELSLKDILGEDMVEGSQVADYEGVVEYLEDMDAGDSIDEEMQKLDDILADLARKQAEAEKDLEG